MYIYLEFYQLNTAKINVKKRQTGYEYNIFAHSFSKKCDFLNQLNSNLTDLSNTVDAKVTGTGTTTLLYEEVTTRNGNGTYISVNSGFLSSGYMTILIIGKQVTIHVAGVSIKSSIDWIGSIHSGYRPYKQEHFSYYLGSTEYTGYINTNGYIYFNTLNTSSVLSATIIYNIA